jgi:amino acid transporter
MTPKLSLMLTGVAVLAGVAVALIVLSLLVAALLPRGHRAADALRRFAALVPYLAVGAGMSVYRLGHPRVSRPVSRS